MKEGDEEAVFYQSGLKVVQGGGGVVVAQDGQQFLSFDPKISQA